VTAERQGCGARALQPLKSLDPRTAAIYKTVLLIVGAIALDAVIPTSSEPQKQGLFSRLKLLFPRRIAAGPNRISALR
jgi:hypothetical protein